MLFAANWILGFIFSPFTRALSFGTPLDTPGKRYTFKEDMFRQGIETDSFLYYLIPLGLMLSVSVYLITRGFILIGITASVLYTLIMAAFAFGWLMCRIRLPIKGQWRNPETSRNLWIKILSRAALFVVALLPLTALRSISPIKLLDFKLGLLFAGLISLLWLSANLIRSPTATNRLRSLRSRLAFGDAAVETVKREVMCVLCGSPEEQYLTEKADEIVSELENYKILSDALVERADEIIAWADKLQSSNSGDSDQGITSEFRYQFSGLKNDLVEIPRRMTAALELRLEFMARVEAAKIVLNIKPAVINGIVKRTDDALREAVASNNLFVSKKERFLKAFDFLCNAQREVKPPKKKKLKTLLDIFKALFGP